MAGDGGEDVLAGGAGYPQGHIPQRTLDALALGDIGGDPAQCIGLAIAVQEGKLYREVDPFTLRQPGGLLDLDG
jgi:hypothetical protein